MNKNVLKLTPITFTVFNLYGRINHKAWNSGHFYGIIPAAVTVKRASRRETLVSGRGRGPPGAEVRRQGEGDVTW